MFTLDMAGSNSYHDPMQRVELLAVGIVMLSALAAIGSSFGRHGRSARLAPQMLLGGACGLLAATVVLVMTIDLVPDAVEAAAGPWVVPVLAIAIAGGALAIRLRHTWRRPSERRNGAQ